VRRGRDVFGLGLLILLRLALMSLAQRMEQTVGKLLRQGSQARGDLVERPFHRVTEQKPRQLLQWTEQRSERELPGQGKPFAGELKAGLCGRGDQLADLAHEAAEELLRRGGHRLTRR